MGEYTICKYIRLSIDDAQTDSVSIESQRTILDRHINELEIQNAKALEIVDNGYSGTNFERPGVLELIELVRAGKVNCIIVKDFSRFGRNAIEVGYYIERVFPLYRIRFISVSDRFDSTEHEGDTGGMEVAFRFLMHEYYSRDLSRKIRSAKQSRMLRGEYVMKTCTYGYKLDGRRKMVIDDVAANIVRKIFAMYSDGMSISDIQRRLYDEKHLSPARYKRASASGDIPDLWYIWEQTTITQILTNEQYLGTYVAGKTKVEDVGSKRSIKVPESEWVRIPNHHPAIIYSDTFEAVREQRAMKKAPTRKREISAQERYMKLGSPLLGKVVCGYCGHPMKLSKSNNTAFKCQYTTHATGAECHKLKISADELENALYEIISKHAQVILNVNLRDSTEYDVTLSQQSEYESRISRLNSEKRELYEQLMLGGIETDKYYTEKAEVDAELSRLNRAYARISDVIEKESAAMKKTAENRQMAQAITDEAHLSKLLVDLLVEKIRIFPNSEVEIIWKVCGFENAVMEAIVDV